MLGSAPTMMVCSWLLLEYVNFLHEDGAFAVLVFFESVLLTCFVREFICIICSVTMVYIGKQLHRCILS